MDARTKYARGGNPSQKLRFGHDVPQSSDETSILENGLRCAYSSFRRKKSQNESGERVQFTPDAKCAVLASETADGINLA